MNRLIALASIAASLIVSGCPGAGSVSILPSSSPSAPLSGSSSPLPTAANSQSPSSRPSGTPNNTSSTSPIPDSYVGPLQSESEIDKIFADGKNHPLRILFRDNGMFRVRKDEGAVRGSNGYGIVALNDTEGIKDFDAMVKPYALGAILSPLGVESTPEAELSKKEVDAEAKIGGDIPNDGSWAEIFLSGPRVSEVKALYAGLRQKAYVRSIQVVGTPTN